MKRFLIACIALIAAFVNPAVFAQIRINELPSAAALTGAEEFPADQGGVTSGVLASQIATYMNSQLAALPSFNAGGVWNFTSPGSISQGVPSVTIENSAPVLEFGNTSAGTNQRRMNLSFGTSMDFSGRLLNDDGSTIIGLFDISGTASNFYSPLTAPDVVAFGSNVILGIYEGTAPSGTRGAGFRVDSTGILKHSLCADDSVTCADYVRVMRTANTVNAYEILTGDQVLRLAISDSGSWSLPGSAGQNSVGTAGQVLTTNGNAAPTWQSLPAAPIIKHARVPTGTIPSSGSAAAGVTVAWASAFADTNYTVTCSVLMDGDAASHEAAGLTMDHMYSQAVGGIGVTVRNGSGADASGTLHCTAIHD